MIRLYSLRVFSRVFLFGDSFPLNCAMCKTIAHAEIWIERFVQGSKKEGGREARFANFHRRRNVNVFARRAWGVRASIYFTWIFLLFAIRILLSPLFWRWGQPLFKMDKHYIVINANLQIAKATAISWKLSQIFVATQSWKTKPSSSWILLKFEWLNKSSFTGRVSGQSNHIVFTH